MVQTNRAPGAENKTNDCHREERKGLKVYEGRTAEREEKGNIDKKNFKYLLDNPILASPLTAFKFKI